MKSKTLTNARVQTLDDWLFKTRTIDKEILELQLKLIKSKKSLDGDERYQSLLCFHTAVRATLDVLDEELTEIFKLRWGVGQRNSWEDIAMKMNLSKLYMRRKKEHILSIFAYFMGFN